MMQSKVIKIDWLDFLIFQVKQRHYHIRMFSHDTKNICDYYYHLMLSTWSELEKKYHFNGYDNYIDSNTLEVRHK